MATPRPRNKGAQSVPDISSKSPHVAPPTPVPAFAPSNPFAQPSSVEHGATPATPQPKHHPAGYPSAGTPSGAPQGYPGGGIPSNATTVPPHARAEHAYAPSPPQPPVYKSKGGRRRSHSRTSGASPGAQPSGNGTGDYRRSASSTSSYSDAGQSGHWHHRSASAASRGESADDGGFRAWQYDIAMEVFRLGQQLGSTELQVRQLQAELYAERVRSLNLQDAHRTLMQEFGKGMQDAFSALDKMLCLENISSSHPGALVTLERQDLVKLISFRKAVYDNFVTYATVAPPGLFPPANFADDVTSSKVQQRSDGLREKHGSQDSADVSPDPATYIELTVHSPRFHDNLGFSARCVRTPAGKAIVVGNISDVVVANGSGLEIGDEILAVNGLSLDGLETDMQFSLLRESGGRPVFRIRRHLQDPVRLQLPELLPETTLPFDLPADTKRGITDRKRQIHAAAMDEPREPQKALQLLLDARHKMRPVLNTDPPQQQMRAAPSGTRHTRTDQADVTATAYVRMSSAAQLTGRNAVNTSLQDSRQQSATQPSRLSPAVTELVNAVVPHGGARKERSGSHANQQSASGGEPVPSTQAYTVQANGLLSQYRDVCSPSERVFVTVIKRVNGRFSMSFGAYGDSAKSFLYLEEKGPKAHPTLLQCGDKLLWAQGRNLVLKSYKEALDVFENIPGTEVVVIAARNR